MVSGGRVRLLRRIDQHQQLAALFEVRLQLVDLRRQQVRLSARRSPRTEASAGIACCSSTSVSAVKLSDPSSCAMAPKPRSSEPVGVALAVSLREVDLVLLALDHLDQPVGQVLFGVRRDALLRARRTPGRPCRARSP